MNKRYASNLNGHTVVRGLDDMCYTFREDNGRVLREVTDVLNCQHEEADTRIMQVSQTSTMRVTGNDTGVLVLLLCYAGVACNCPNVWMDVVLSSKQHQAIYQYPKAVW